MTIAKKMQIAIDTELEWIWDNRLVNFSACESRLIDVTAKSQQQQYHLGIQHALILKAQLHIYLGKFNEAILLANNALDALTTYDKSIYNIRALNILGVAYMATSEFGESLQHYKAALALCENLPAKDLHMILLLNIGELYRGALNENEKALPFYLQALELSKTNPQSWTPMIISATALCLIRLGKVSEGLPLVEESRLLIDQIDASHIKNNVYQTVAQSYKELHALNEAVALLDKALSEMGEPQFRYVRLNLYLIMAQALQERGDSNQALTYCHMLLNENEGQDNNMLLLNLYKVMGNAYKNLGQFELGAQYLGMAIDKMEKDISDRIERHTSVFVADMKYKTMEKDLEIHRLRNVELKEQSEMLEMTAAKLQSTLDDLVQTQTQLIKTEKLAALGELVAGVSHEINTPLGTGVTVASFIEVNLKDVQRHMLAGTLSKKFLDTSLKGLLDSVAALNSNLEKAADIVNSFKQVAIDQSTYECRSFNVLEYINDTLTMIQPILKLNNFQIEVICDDALEIVSYPGALYQMVYQLSLNAVTHGFKDRHTGLIQIEIHANNQQICLRFSDNGQGILPVHQSRIFDPFYSTNKNKGNIGLGLHLLHNLVHQVLHGTIVLVESTSVKTVFEINFKEGCVKQE